MQQSNQTVRVLAGLVCASMLAMAPSFASTENAPTSDVSPMSSMALAGVAEFLRLAPEQREAFKFLLDQREQQMAPLREEVFVLERQLQQLVDHGNDPAAVGVTVLNIHERHQALHAIQAEFLHSFEALLRAPQLTKVRQVRRAFKLRDIVPAFAKLDLL